MRKGNDVDLRRQNYKTLARKSEARSQKVLPSRHSFTFQSGGKRAQGQQSQGTGAAITVLTSIQVEICVGPEKELQSAYNKP